MSGALTVDYLKSKLDENGTSFLEVRQRIPFFCELTLWKPHSSSIFSLSLTPPRSQGANSVGYGSTSYDELLKQALVPKGQIDYFVELHIEQVKALLIMQHPPGCPRSPHHLRAWLRGQTEQRLLFSSAP